MHVCACISVFRKVVANVTLCHVLFTVYRPDDPRVARIRKD